MLQFLPLLSSMDSAVCSLLVIGEKATLSIIELLLGPECSFHGIKSSGLCCPLDSICQEMKELVVGIHFSAGKVAIR